MQRAMRLGTITFVFTLMLTFAVAGPAVSGQAQTPKDPVPAPATAAEPNVITLPVVVRDKKGQIVRDLTKDDFVLLEDGKPLTIKYFSQQAELPVTLGLLIDTTWSQRDSLDQERNASRTFLDQVLTQDKDKAFLLHFDREVELLQDLTHKREKLQSALDLLKTSDRERSNDDSDSRAREGGGRQLYDAVFLASNELLQKQPGRKAVIILSDGVDRGSRTSLLSAIESAQKSDTIVYSMMLPGRREERGEHRRDEDNGNGRRGGGWPGGGGGYPGGGGGWPGGGGPGGPGGGPGGNRRGGGQRPQEGPRVDGKKILEQLSKETGGRSLEVSKKLSVGEIYTAIAEELRTQYTLGFLPQNGASGGYHRLELQTKRKDLVVQTREGYYGGGD